MSTYVTTRLDAINQVLGTVGAGPVGSLTPGIPESAIAEALFDSANREVQGMGWWANREIDHTISPTAGGEFLANPNWIRINPKVGRYPNKRLHIKAGLIYDADERTTALGLDSLVVDLVIFRDFATELPESIKSFIVAKASRAMQMRVIGDVRRDGMLKDVEDEAHHVAKQHDNEQGDYSLLNNLTSQRVLGRVGETAFPVAPALGVQGEL